MVLKNLFTGQQWRNRHREQTSEHEERGGEGRRGEERVRCMERVPRPSVGGRIMPASRCHHHKSLKLRKYHMMKGN